MTEINPDRTEETISLAVIPQENGQYICQISSSLSDRPDEQSNFYGQTKEHAIAIALEHLASRYRKQAEKLQNNTDWDAVELSDSGEVIEKRYHIILHYERVADEESKFEAMQNTLLGNTVVERGKLSIIEIAPDLPVKRL
ncbi:MAG: hypothetical protein HC942_16990 [Microcoleus sp. SU_5_6]|nr:hypothetical protein [Microcoleus sp. SU_5_6]NJL66704.1 hypothetical protein [Microcoleus sp. SM1_3_4]